MITSSRNPRIAAARRLRSAKERRASGRTTIDGPFLFDEAMQNGVEIVEVFAATDDLVTTDRSASAGIPFTIVTQDVLRSLGGSVTPRGPIAVIAIPLSRDLESRDTIVLWDIGDPGNAGTIIRTAAAFGFQVAATSGSVDLWSPKVIRSGVGGHFRARPVEGLAPDGRRLQDAGLRLVAAVREGGVSPGEALRSDEPIAILIGNEAHGLPQAIVDDTAALAVSLPMPGRMESLNASVAASILMYLRLTA